MGFRAAPVQEEPHLRPFTPSPLQRFSFLTRCLSEVPGAIRWTYLFSKVPFQVPGGHIFLGDMAALTALISSLALVRRMWAALGGVTSPISPGTVRHTFTRSKWGSPLPFSLAPVIPTPRGSFDSTLPSELCTSLGFPGGAGSKEPTCPHGFDP